jgi:hypothetical protein
MNQSTNEPDAYALIKKNFFEYLLYGQVTNAQALLERIPELALTTSEDNLSPLIYALTFHHQHGNGVKLINLLAEYKADFNAKFINEEQVQNTPLSFTIRNAPFNDDLYQPLIANGADISHDTVEEALNYVVNKVTSAESSMYSFNADKVIESVNKLKMWQNKPLISDKYHKNSQVFEEGEQCRIGAKIPTYIDKIKIGYDKKMYINVDKHNPCSDEYTYEDLSTTIYVIGGKAGQKIALNVLAGKCSYEQVLSKLEAILGEDEIYNSVDAKSNYFTKFLYASPGHARLRSLALKRVIDEDLEQLIAHELGIDTANTIGTDPCWYGFDS